MTELERYTNIFGQVSYGTGGVIGYSGGYLKHHTNRIHNKMLKLQSENKAVLTYKESHTSAYRGRSAVSTMWAWELK